MSWLMAAVYDRVMGGAEAACLGAWRRELLAGTRGRVLDVGAGTGANLAWYPASVDEIVLAEPDPHMGRRLSARLSGSGVRAEVVSAPAEALPLPDASVDAVVCTFVLCSVGDPARALAELHRVLVPGGSFIFLEHVAAEPGSARLRWQRRVEPLWRRLAGNCHLTRDSEAAIRAAGFELDAPTRESIRAVAPVVRPSVRGIARKPG